MPTDIFFLTYCCKWPPKTKERKLMREKPWFISVFCSLLYIWQHSIFALHLVLSLCKMSLKHCTPVVAAFYTLLSVTVNNCRWLKAVENNTRSQFNCLPWCASPFHPTHKGTDCKTTKAVMVTQGGYTAPNYFYLKFLILCLTVSFKEKKQSQCSRKDSLVQWM